MAKTLSRVTNLSLKLVIDAVPNLMRTNEGNAVLLEVTDRFADRSIQVAEIAEGMIQRWDPQTSISPFRPAEGETFNQKITRLDEEDPVVNDALLEAIQQGSAAGDGILTETILKMDDLNKKTERLLRGQQTTQVNEDPAIATEEVNAMESGTPYIWLDGQTYIKD